MTKTIINKLRDIERKYNIRILYACESGSRAWGFSSNNSDYDIRFIYVHRLDWYLTTQDNRDVIELMEGDLDFSGWELRKALKLMAKGNPPLMEWINSPITYIEYNDNCFVADFEELTRNSFNSKAAIYHYLGMAKRNYNQYIKDKAYVKLKKYLYVIRPLLSCIYIQEKGKMAPTLINPALALIESYKAHAEVVALITAKKAGQELDMGLANEVLNQFIEETMFFFDLYVLDLIAPKVDYKALNKLLYKQILDFTNGNS